MSGKTTIFTHQRFNDFMNGSTKTIFKQTSIYSIGNTLRKLSGVFILPLVKHYTSQEEFGVWMLLETIFVFTQVLSGWGVKSGLTRWYYDMVSELEKKRLFFTAMVFNYAMSLLTIGIIGGVLACFSDQILKYDISSRLIWVFIISGLFRLLHELPFIVLRLQQKAMKQTAYSSFNVLLLVLFTFFFLEFSRQGFIGVFKAQLWSNLITFLVLIPVIVKNSQPVFKWAELKEMIHYGIPLAFSNILTTVLNLSDRHIINQFQNPAESGSYGLSFKVANLLEMVLVTSFITSYTYFYFKSLNDPDSFKVFKKLQRYFLILLAIVGFGIVLFAREIIWVTSVGDAFYQDGVYLVPFLILGLMFGGLRQFFTLPLNKHKKTRAISRILISGGIVNVVLNVWLVPQYGKQGAAWATLFVQFFMMVWFYLESGKCETLTINIKESLLLLFIWGGFVAVSFFVPENLFLALLYKASLMGFFLLALFLFKVIRLDEIKELIETVKGVLQRK
ncbi:multidrug transporter MatE [Marinilabiliaceae bacterium JC017]|nr:multidrug transporter MatE [Marinilabiliaceae bacterium JC017]